MEAAGLAFATLSVVEHLIHAYGAVAELVQDVKNFDNDRESLVARITTEKAITVRLKILLFSPPGQYGAPDLFSQLDIGTREGLYASFMLFMKAIERYLPLEGLYGLSHKPLPLNAVAVVPELEVAAGSAAGKLPVKPLQLLIWGLWDKKKVTGLVEEMEIWNKKITQVIELHLLSRQVSVWGLENKPVPQISATTEFKDLGIQNALAAQAQALALPMPEEEGVAKDFERKWTELSVPQNSSRHLNFEIGRFENSVVIADSKSHDGRLSDEQKQLASARLNQLASVLRNLHRIQNVIPECICWMNRPNKGAYSLLFSIPPSLEPRPQSLYDALSSESTLTGPPLDERFKIAYHLASAIDSLHSVSWIHKSIRSDNILFYITKDEANTPSPLPSSGEDQNLPPKWFLYGFEYARNVDASSSAKSDSDPHRNIYRHPRRWGVPTMSFGPIHDIYALGVVLLELGIWRRAPSLIKGAESGSTRPLDPFSVRKELEKRAGRYLGYAAGVSYRDAVLRCLRSDFGIDLKEDAYEGRMKLAARFRAEVVDELRALAFPHHDSRRLLG